MNQYRVEATSRMCACEDDSEDCTGDAWIGIFRDDPDPELAWYCWVCAECFAAWGRRLEAEQEAIARAISGYEGQPQ